MNPPQVEAPRTRDRLRALVSLIASLALVFAGISQTPQPVRAIDTLTILHYPRISGGASDLAIGTNMNGQNWQGQGSQYLNQSWSPTATSVIYRWYRCTAGGVEASTLPAGCAPITGAQDSGYETTEADVGSYFRFAITGYYGTASSRIWSETVGPVIPNANIIPAFTYVEPLSGETAVEQYLSVNSVEYVAYPSTSARSVAWWRCTEEGGAVDEVSDCTIARSAEFIQASGYPWRYGAGSYELTTSDIGYFMRAQLTITNTLGTDSIFTPTSEEVRAQDAILPYFTADPEIYSEPLVGTQPENSWGSYNAGSPAPLTIAYAWYTCTNEGDSAATLPSGCSLVKNSSSYTPTLATVGTFLRISRTLTNPTGSVTHYSATSAAVREPASTVPTINAWPSISATAKEGSRITADWGGLVSWGYPKLNRDTKQEWYSCLTSGGEAESLPANCTKVGLTDRYLYTPELSDVGRYLRAAMTYTNNAGSILALSATSAAVLPHERYVPQSVVVPALTGLAMVTQRLVGNIGEWNAYPTAVSYAYRWYRCTDAGVAATSLPSDCTGLSAYTLGYTSVSADLNKYMRLAVTATNGVGSSTIWSQATARVVASALVAPVANNAPCIALDFGGDPYVGAIVSESGCSVTFSGNPPIVGTTSAWYRCNASDTGRTSGSSVSGCVIVQRNVIRPTRASFGTVFNGEVSPAATSDNGYSYQFGPADEGKHLRLAITATNTRGKATAWSATVGPILGASEVTGKLPISIFPPSLLDAPIVGEQYWQDGGAWVEYGDSDYPPISSYEVRWYRCTSTGEFSDTLPSGCSSAPGTSSGDNYGYEGRGSTYLPVASDVGYHLRAAVTAYNAVGQSTLYSATSAAVTAPPNEPPSILNPVTIWYDQTGAQVGSEQNATWSAYPSIDNVTYQWYRCSGEAGVAIDARPANCSKITGATSTYYETTSADADFRLRVRAHGENIAGEANSFSATSALIADPAPRNMGGPAAPRLSGGTAVGFPMTAAPGTWDAPTALELQFIYAWYSCTRSGIDTPASLPSGCSVITGKTASTFSPTTTQRGKYIRVGVTASNGRGSGVRFSATLGAVGNGPTSSSAPTVTGTARVNSMLTAANGTWTGSPTYTYTWWRCTVSGTDTPATPPDTCARISGATLYRYTLTASERTWYIRIAVTATASGVAVTRFSRTTAVIQ